MRRVIFLLGCALATLAAQACSSDDGGSTPSINDGAGGAGGSGSGASGSSGQGGAAGAGGATGGAGGAGGGGAGVGGAAGASAGAAGAAGGGAGAGQGGAGQGGFAGEVVGGSSAVSGASGSGGDGGAAADPVPVCKPTQPWAANPASNDTVLPSGANGVLKEQRQVAALSGDGLTVAWSTQDKIFYADRAAATEPVQQYQQLPAAIEGAGYPAIEKVAVSGDRKRLVMVSADRTRLGQLTRANPGEPFGSAVDENPFAEVIKARQGAESVGDPVLVSDDSALYVAFYTSDTSRLVVSKRAADGSWAAPEALDDPALASPAGTRRRLWWVSSDQLTVFMFDPDAKTSVGWWRKNIGKPFEQSLPLGSVQAPFAEDKCIRLTYSAPNAQSVLDVFAVNKI